MNRKAKFAVLLVLFSILTACNDRFDNEEEIVLVDQPEEEKYQMNN